MKTNEKFQKIVDLFKRSFTEELDDNENRKLQTLLENPEFAGLYKDMKSGRLLGEGMENRDKFPANRGFRRFERQIDRRSGNYRTLIIRIAAAAVIFIAGSVGFLTFYKPNADRTIVAEQIITPGTTNAVLMTAQGETILLSKEPVYLEAIDGVKVRYEEGTISYATSEKDAAEGEHELRVPAGGECQVVLDDGTKVWVNSKTILRYPARFNDEERRVFLEGEAYFDVVASERPFIVHTLLGEIKVLGTEFNIHAYPEEGMATTLISGSVLYSGKENIPLIPGEQLIVSSNWSTEKSMVDVEEFIDWKNGKFVFYDRTLEEIMKNLGRWYDVSVSFSNPELKHILFSGDIERYENINSFLELLKKTEKINYTIKSNHIEFY